MSFLPLSLYWQRRCNVMYWKCFPPNTLHLDSPDNFTPTSASRRMNFVQCIICNRSKSKTHCFIFRRLRAELNLQWPDVGDLEAVCQLRQNALVVSQVLHSAAFLQYVSGCAVNCSRPLPYIPLQVPFLNFCRILFLTRRTFISTQESAPWCVITVWFRNFLENA